MASRDRVDLKVTWEGEGLEVTKETREIEEPVARREIWVEKETKDKPVRLERLVLKGRKVPRDLKDLGVKPDQMVYQVRKVKLDCLVFLDIREALETKVIRDKKGGEEIPERKEKE